MRLPYKLGAFIIASITLFSCNDDALDFQNNLQPSSDAISLDADTFHLETSTGILQSIPSSKNPSTYLLGSYTDGIYGSKKAEILAQLNCPSGVVLPQTIDSSNLILNIYVSAITTLGDSNLTLRAYRMDKNTFVASQKYNSDINVSDYCSKSDELGFVTQKYTKAATFSISLNDDLKEELLDSLKHKSSIFNSNEKFASFFNGLNIILDGDSKTMLTVSSVNMVLKYYYTSNGQVVANTLPFAASKDVKQVNAISASLMPALVDTVLYASSPAGLYGKIKVPVEKIRQRFGISVQNGVAKLANGSKLNVNTAFINMQVVGDSTLSKISYPEYLALVRKSEFEKYFSRNLPENLSTELIGAYSSNSYSFSVPSYLVNLIKDPTCIEDELYLVPVSIDLNSSNEIISVRHDSKFTAVMLKSGRHLNFPMKLDVVVSGF